MLSTLVLETCSAPGTGATVNLAGAPAGRRTFASAFASGINVYYFLDDGAQAEWGYGAFTSGTPNTLARSTVIGNTAGTTSRLNFTGLTRVYNDLPASRALWIDGNGVLGAPLVGKGATPVGSGMDFFGATAPDGWLFAAGQAVSRTGYAALFAVLGTTCGVGNGTTTFNLPDKRGRVSVAADNLGGTAANRVTSAVSGVNGAALGATGGDQRAQAHAHTATASTSVTISDPTHTHSLSDPQHSHPVSGLIGSGIGGGAGTSFGSSAGSTAAASTGISVNNAATGITASGATSVTVASAESGASQNMQPSLICNYIIYAGV